MLRQARSQGVVSELVDLDEDVLASGGATQAPAGLNFDGTSTLHRFQRLRCTYFR